MKAKLKTIGMTMMAIVMLPLTLLLIIIGYLWGHACKATSLGARTAALGSMVRALEEEGHRR